jgi:uncharacterized membrane protein required for colicin V production
MSTPPLTTVDIIVLACILLGAVQGLFRRLSGEMARLIGTICAFILGTVLHQPLGQWIANHTRLIDQEAKTATYILTVIVALIFWIFFHRMIKKLLQMIVSAKFDMIAGIIAGATRVLILAMIIFIAINMWPDLPMKDHFGETSLFGKWAIALTPTVQEHMEKHQNIPPFHKEDRSEETPDEANFRERENPP